MRRWSKLKKDLEDLMDPSIKFQIYCNAYEIGSYGNQIPRFWITIDRDIIWDFPKHFVELDWYYHDLDFSELFRNYINTPTDDLMNLALQPSDKFRIIPLLIASDKRIGKRRLKQLQELEQYQPYIHIINKRLNIVE